MSYNPPFEEMAVTSHFSMTAKDSSLSPTVDSLNYSATLAPVSFIGKAVTIKGHIVAKEDMFINGKIEGTLVLKDNQLEIGEEGYIEANAIAKVIIIGGEFKGDLFASEQIIIKKTGRIEGNIYAGNVSVEDGALIKGIIDMKKEERSSPHTPFSHLAETRTRRTAKFGLLFKKMRAIAHLNGTTPLSSYREEPAIIPRQEADEVRMLSVPTKSYPERYPAEKSLIGEAVLITGELIAEEDLMFQGQLDGSVYFKECQMIVGNRAQIQSHLFVQSLITYGEIKGNVYASDLVEIKKPSQVFGNIHAPRVSIESGALLMGSMDMRSQDVAHAFAEAKRFTYEDSLHVARKGEEREHKKTNMRPDIYLTKDLPWSTYHSSAKETDVF